MERLTARNKNGMAYLVGVKENEQDVESKYPNTLKCILECFDKLAIYEELVPELLRTLEITIDRLDDGSAWSDENLDEIKLILTKVQGLEDKV